VGRLPPDHWEKRESVRLWSRNGIDVTQKYALLLPALQKIEGSCILDGELCALDAHGRSRFQLLQNALNKKARLLYVVFDELFVDGKDISERPLLERKKVLKALLPRDPLLRYSEHVAEFGRREFAEAQRADEEGVIAKRAAGLYYSGKRTLKFKAAPCAPTGSLLIKRWSMRPRPHIPKLVSEVKFTEWPSEGEMRHPAFLRLRIDKKAFDVIREQA
jgi:bifunctional non-homologous end joining protein LigD